MVSVYLRNLSKIKNVRIVVVYDVIQDKVRKKSLATNK